METKELVEITIKLPSEFRHFKEACNAIGLSFEDIATAELVTNLHSIIDELEQGSNPEGPFLDKIVDMFRNEMGIKPKIETMTPPSKTSVDVVIQVPIDTWKLYKDFCENYEHALPTDLIEQTAVDSIRNSMEDAIDEGRYTPSRDVQVIAREEHEPSTMAIVINIPVQFKHLDAWLSKKGSSLNDVVKRLVEPWFDPGLEGASSSNLPERISELISKDGEDSDQYTDEILQILRRTPRKA